MKKNDNKSMRFLRWLFIVALVWGIPSIIFWVGMKLYIDDQISYKAEQIHTDLDYELDNIIYKSSANQFYQSGFKKLFRQLKGLPSNPEILKRIINEYKNTWPAKHLEIYLFNGENKIYPIEGAKPEHELFFNLIVSDFDTGDRISASEVSAVGRFLPSPDLSLNYARGQNGKIIELGNPDRYSYCFFEHDKSINKDFVGGILIFVHNQEISTAQILERTTVASNQQNFGFANSLGDSSLPGILKDLAAEELLDYFQQYPLNSFTLNDHLISLKRFDEYVLLVGARKKPSALTPVIILLAVAYLFSSLLFLRFSYKLAVLQIRFHHNVRQRLLGLFTLCYALPLMAAIFLAIQYMVEFRHSISADIKHENYRRLAEIDSGFNRFVTAKLLDLRQFSQKMQENVKNKSELMALMKDLYQSFEADSAHLIASNSEILFTTDLLTAEIRRHYRKSRQEKQKILESWKYRQAKLSDKHIKMLFSSGDEEGKPQTPEISEGHSGFSRIFRSTALSAMDFYNRSRDISIILPRSSSDLIIDTIIESNTQSLFQSARTNISRFTNIQGMNEIFKAYLDVIAGPGKEAWYCFAILIDLVNYERQYFEQLYSDLRSRSEILNRVFPEEDIRAISNHQFAANFPSAMEFRNFEGIIKRSANDFKTFTQRMKVDGQDCLVSVLKASYLKHYLLVKVLPVQKIEQLFYQRIHLILFFLSVIVLLGIALVKLLNRLFILPINDIMTGVKALAARDYEHRIPVRNENEFGVLARSFNESAAILKKLAISEKIRKNIYPDLEFRCGSYLISTANSNSRIILSDFFDYFPLKQGLYATILAEVSGNDISAAYLTAMLKTSFTLLCPSFPTSPELILEKLNQIFLPYYQKGHLTTCFIGIIDPTNDKMICANAGQSYPICLGSNSTEEKSYLSLPSTPLGLSADTIFRKHEFSLIKKTVVLYSDGAVNLVNNSGRKIGHESFLELVADIVHKDPRNPSKSILEKLNEESMSVPWRDDITILTIQNRI
jgi:sigma-B regulation protein RsbU (phosphoserine phosphatase)